MTLTTERLREIASSPSFSANPLSHEVKYMARELLANREAQPVAVPEYLTYLRDPIISNVLADDDNSPMANAARILAREVKFWRHQPLFTAPTADAELLDVAIALREWIDAVPSELAASLPTMPGVDRDWVDEVIDTSRAAMLAAAPEGGNDHDTRR
ncbi:Uncharacterised protein [Serratia entomophila]|uniref:hypothetical protein n=1 Tax=Serratia entomophila TaxID=42906 RepID=UPI002179F48B|nr:hypothetical protein [Serratia entomophila]CAI1788404.1 Uncharacterised protein [Serratia entomophila]